jgi:anti-anti-sigma regulatory factor
MQRGDYTVLRISRIESPDTAVTIRLEGQVSGPWVEELRRSCEQFLETGSRLRLDLTEVSFMDMNGVVLCRRLRDRDVAFLYCSPFVAEQLRG